MINIRQLLKINIINDKRNILRIFHFGVKNEVICWRLITVWCDTYVLKIEKTIGDGLIGSKNPYPNMNHKAQILSSKIYLNSLDLKSKFYLNNENFKKIATVYKIILINSHSFKKF